MCGAAATRPSHHMRTCGRSPADPTRYCSIVRPALAWCTGDASLAQATRDEDAASAHMADAVGWRCENGCVTPPHVRAQSMHVETMAWARWYATPAALRPVEHGRHLYTGGVWGLRVAGWCVGLVTTNSTRHKTIRFKSLVKHFTSSVNKFIRCGLFHAHDRAIRSTALRGSADRANTNSKPRGRGTERALLVSAARTRTGSRHGEHDAGSGGWAAGRAQA